MCVSLISLPQRLLGLSAPFPVAPDNDADEAVVVAVTIEMLLRLLFNRHIGHCMVTFCMDR